MLFYTQIRREFTPTSWRRAQIYFREGRVNGVKLEGDLVSGKVKGTEKQAYETAIVMARGTIYNSKCSCPAHRMYETHCKHVAALAIWVVERGSLLRAGVTGGGDDLGMAQTRAREGDLILRNAEKAALDVRLRKLILAHPVIARSRFVVRRDLMAGSVEGRDAGNIPYSVPITLVEAAALLEHSESAVTDAPSKDVVPGEPILFVRGSFQGKVLSALTVESGIRYRDPTSHTTQVSTLTYLSKQPDPGIWKTTQGLLLYVPPHEIFTDREANFIQKLDTLKVVFTGQAALEELAKLLDHKFREEMVFDVSIANVRVDPTPLRLVSVKLGQKNEKSRELTYEFQGNGVHFTSQDLEDLAKLGRLSNHYVWKDDRIYRFETSLMRLAQYANRTGVAAAEARDGEAVSTHARGSTSLHDDAEHPLHPIAAYRLSLELGVENFQVDTDWKEFHEWKKTFERTKIPALPKVPYGFKLRVYQKNGLSWLWSLYHRGLASLLADEMGLGKTHQVLAFLTSLYAVKGKKVKQPSLVVAPTSVIAAWIQKLKKYDTGLKWHVYHGSGRVMPAKGVDIVLTTYGILHREEVLREKEWHVVVLDEAQAIKNASTISSRAARALKGKFHIAMTGTPIENQASDLWSLMEFMLPGYLGSLARFKRLYGWGRDMPSAVEASSLKRLIYPFLLRRTKAQVLKELPEKTEEVVQCDMTAAQKKAYRNTLNGAEAVKARENLAKGGKVDYANILAVLTRLKQVCDHPKLADLTAGRVKHVRSLDPTESGKWESFDELLREALGSNLKVVVFTQYLGIMDLISHHLTQQDIMHTDLRGDTPDRAARLELFANDPNCKVFICSLLAGGLGIDLTAGSVCIHFDRWWNPARENQATDRLHRFGQTRGVQVFKLQTNASVEDRIASIIESKVALSGALIEQSAVGLKAFSRKDLLEMLTPQDAD